MKRRSFFAKFAAILAAPFVAKKLPLEKYWRMNRGFATRIPCYVYDRNWLKNQLNATSLQEERAWQEVIDYVAEFARKNPHATWKDRSKDIHLGLTDKEACERALESAQRWLAGFNKSTTGTAS